MNASNGLIYDLRHGVQLAVWNTSGQLGIREVRDFLARAMGHFKEARNTQKTDLYTGAPYCHTATVGRNVLGKLQLSCPNKEGLSLALWTDAVVAAFARADTVRQMMEALPTWQKIVERDPGYVSEAVGMLDKPGGDLLALEVMIKHVRRD